MSQHITEEDESRLNCDEIKKPGRHYLIISTIEIVGTYMIWLLLTVEINVATLRIFLAVSNLGGALP